MGINFTKGWSSPLDNPITRGLGDGVDAVTGGAKTVKRMSGNIYDDLTGVTEAERIQDAQTQAVESARQERELGYRRATDQLQPYKELGDNVMFGEMQYKTERRPKFNSWGKVTGYEEVQVPTGQRSGGLADDIKSGKYVQDDFNYQGEQPDFQYRGRPLDAFDYQGDSMASKVDYDGQQTDPFNYRGEGQRGEMDYTGQQQGAIDYAGGPVDRSIESYMQDDPSLAWQQEQMEKAINRQGAAKGRWGGGATAREMMRDTAGLLSKDYANRFDRARFEREADVGTEESKYDRAYDATELSNLAEQSTYDRSKSAFDAANLAEQSQYNRASDQYKYDTDRENQAYKRAYDDTLLGNQASQEAYKRDYDMYTSGVNREKDLYGRYSDAFTRDIDREQSMYDRALKQYEIEGTQNTNALNQQLGLANYGSKMSQAMANAALGKGSALADLYIQQGNINAAAAGAKGTPWSNAADLYGRVQEGGQDAAKLFGGGF